jgi:hypothetical protein
MQEADEEVGSTEQDRVVSEGARHRQRGDKHRRGRSEDGQPHTASSRSSVLVNHA